MISRLLSSIYTFFQNLISVLGDILGFLFQKLFDFLKILLYPILIVVALVFYFVYKVAVLAITLLKVLLGIGKIFVALVKGIFATLAGFTFTSTTRNDGDWTNILSNVSDGLNYFQFDNIAYVLLFLIWFTTAFSAIRIISSMRGGE